MNSSPSPCHSGVLRGLASGLGISAIGTARIEPVEDAVVDSYRRWIGIGHHGDMSYLDRYHDIRHNPELLLPGARTIIVAAFNYYPSRIQRADAPQFAYYAYGRDYHEVVRDRLRRLSAEIESRWGGESRVCVDTAPLFERYWAVKAGIGIIGLNSQLIIPGKGSYFFLGEILTTLTFDHDSPIGGDCGRCGRCISRCPAGAISSDGSVNASKCLSYLTIEYRGDLPEGSNLGNHVYGCDECQKACPHNRNAKPTDIDEFTPSDEFLQLDIETLRNLDRDRFNALFRHSAVKRAKLEGLLRNARSLSSADDFVTL